jgi:hypothetical protein
MIQTQPLEIDNFNGGITDFYVNAPINKCQRADNLILLKYSDTIAKLTTRQGSTITNATYYQIPAADLRIGYLKYFENTLLRGAANKIFYVGANWVTLQGPTGNEVFPSAVTELNYWSSATWNRHLFVASDAFSKPQKIYPNASNILQVRTAGMPALASNPTVTAGGAGANSYIYRFLYYYTYTVDTRVFEDRGPITSVALASALAPDASTVAITSIPVLANGSTDNYDTASSNLKVEIYRTIAGGTVFYRIGTVNNGTTSFNDTFSDATIQANNFLLYTEGGVVENDPPPLCKLVHVIGDTGYYAHIKEGSEIIRTRLMQSVEGDPDSVPQDFICDVDDEIVGLSSVKGNPVLLCRDSAYRVDGTYDELGRNGMIAQKISDTCSCVSGQSVVQTLMGTFWAGKDGFYFTDGYKVSRINRGWRNTYALFVTSEAVQRKIQGKYDRKNNRIWWTVQASSADVDTCYILDLNWGITEDMPFTSASNGTSFNPSALEFVDGVMYRGDVDGYTFTHTDLDYSDPKINTSAVPSTWIQKTIVYNYVSAAINFGSNFTRKWASRITIAAKAETNLSLLVKSINDDYRQVKDLKEIRYRGNILWGNDDIYWGDSGIAWNQEGAIIKDRRFPARSLRFNYKQIQLTNAMVAILTSDTIGTVTVTPATATLDNVTFSWPTQAVDYYISFANDGYVKEYLITARTNTALTFSDSLGSAPLGAGAEFVIRGLPKNEILYLLSYTLHWSAFGTSQGVFHKTQTGEVGA